MWNAVRHTWNDQTIRIATITVIFLGCTYASTIPYYSLIGVQQLGMSAGQYALLSGVAAAMAMVGSVIMGFFADRSTNRKRGVMLSLGFGLMGFGGFFLYPSIWTFTAFLLVITPVSGAAYTQLFAIIRSVANARAPAEATQINSTARAVYALSWVVVPGIVGAYIATRKDTSDGFAIAVIAFSICILLYGFLGAPGGRVEPSSMSAWQGLKEAFGLVASRRIASRIMALSMIASVQPLNLLLLPLIIVEMPEGSTQSIGIIAGLTAALEVPLMLLGGYVASRIQLWKIMLAGGLVFAVYIGLVGLATSMQHLYLLAVLNAVGNAILLTLHLSYLQNLLPDRPGLGTSLLSIGGLVCKIISACVFALVGTRFGFFGATSMAAVIAIAGCAMLFIFDRTDTTSE